jgi:hypothetical protein
LTLDEDDRLYVHSEAANPARWRYVQSTAEAARSIVAKPRRLHPFYEASNALQSYSAGAPSWRGPFSITSVARGMLALLPAPASRAFFRLTRNRGINSVGCKSEYMIAVANMAAMRPTSPTAELPSIQ